MVRDPDELGLYASVKFSLESLCIGFSIVQRMLIFNQDTHLGKSPEHSARRALGHQVPPRVVHTFMHARSPAVPKSLLYSICHPGAPSVLDPLRSL